MGQINIQLILDGCRRENRDAQRRLYEHFFGYGMSICLRYSKSRDEALEIFNDGLLKVFTRLDQFDPAFRFEGWLRSILIRTAIDYHRSQHRFPEPVGLENLAEQPDDDSTLMAILSPDEDVLPILQKLSPAYRVVFNLYVMEDYRHHEIAEMLGISVSASRSNLVRAKQQLLILLAPKLQKAVKTSWS